MQNAVINFVIFKIKMEREISDGRESSYSQCLYTHI